MDAQTTTVTLKRPSDFKYDKTKAGWKLLKNAWLFGEPRLSLVRFNKEGEGHIEGEVMLERAKEFGDRNKCGQRHAERLLEQQDAIPENWRGFTLVFPKTVWRDSKDKLFVPCLNWDDNEWTIAFLWIGAKVDCNNYRLVCLAA